MGLSRRSLLASTALLAAAGCSTRIGGEARPNPADLKKVQEPPSGGIKAVRAVIISFEPYTVGTGANLKGPIPDVARKILTDLGADTVQFVLVNEQEKILAMLAAGQLDIAGGVAVRADLCQNATFSNPDFVSGTAFAVPAGNPKGLRTYADVVAQGAKVAVFQGAPEQQDAANAGITQVLPLSDPTSLLRAVTDGQADCFAFDDISLRHMVKTIGQGLEVTAPFMPDGRLPYIGAYLFPQDSQLVEPFNDKLADLHSSGDWLRMVEPFGFTKDNEPPAELTADKACGR